MDKISKSYDQHVIIPELSLSIADEEFIVLVGPSGCGKSTALRMIAGLETITSGTIRIGGQVVNNVEPKDRDIAMVFQNYALYPHMSVYDNMAFGLKMRKIPKGTIDEKVRETAKMLELDHLLDRKPRQLSGGQRQRVALGRAIVRNPKVFLMDEPLSNLDAKLRVQMRREILQLHQRIRTTTIYVTHDQVEAMTMGDRIVILNKGQIQQVGRPTDVYEQPNNLFVAGFIGQMNFIPTTYNSEKSQLLLSEGAAWTVPSNARDALKNYNDKPVVLCIRPEHWEPAHNMSQTEGFTIKATPSQIEHLGSEKIIQFPFNGETVLAKVPPDFPVSTGETIHLRVQPEKVLVFDKANEERITVLGSPTMVGANA